METAGPSRRQFISWTLASFIAPTVSAAAATGLPDWAAASLERQCRGLFGGQLPPGARSVMSATKDGVIAAIFEVEDVDTRGVVRLLCIASERSPGCFSTQVSADALRYSDSFNPTDAALEIEDDGGVNVSEQHVRGHTRHIWKNIDGKWCLSKRTFAGVEAHKFVTEEYDLEKEEFVMARGPVDSDEFEFKECRKTTVLVELGTYQGGIFVA